jgi:hypothetical protein
MNTPATGANAPKQWLPDASEALARNFHELCKLSHLAGYGIAIAIEAQRRRTVGRQQKGNIP